VSRLVFQLAVARLSLFFTSSSLLKRDLRSLRASQDLDAYWQFHLAQEYQREHAARHLNGRAPVPQLPAKQVGKGAHLRLVK